MFKRIIAALVMLIIVVSTSQAVVFAKTSNQKNFTFSKGEMTKEVLGNYLSRAVSFQGLCVEAEKKDPLFEEDLRMIQRIGAKFIGRTAFYSWSGNMDEGQIENHFKIAEEQAQKLHKADEELLLQACIFEIIFKGTVESTTVPEWVLKEFDQTGNERKFDFEKMLPPSGSIYGVGYWSGKEDTAVPYIGNTETQMYFYYLITRYIDAGYEAVHLGQVELIMNREFNLVNAWDNVLTKARKYAKEKARRGVVLFDGHRELNSKGLKVGDRMIMDFYSCGAVTHETELKNGAEHAKMLHYEENGVSWIGRSPSGIHPLGFEMDKAFTLAEFDNYNGAGSSGQPHIATYNDVYCWGYDLITWYAIQPEWYRNQYLLECDEFFKSVELDSDGNQTCFIQPACRRVICPEEPDRPTTKFKLASDTNADELFAYFEREKIEYELDNETKEITMRQNSNSVYRANYQSDDCLIGSNQEDTIRYLFLGNAPEDSKLLPRGYVTDSKKTDTNTETVENTTDMWLWVISAALTILAIVILAITLVFKKKVKK